MKPDSPLLVAVGVKDPAKWLEAVVETCVEFEINTPQRIAGFLAQTSHESGGYTMLSENLNYKAATLAACWPTRFAVLGPDKKPKKDEKGKNIPTAVANSIAGKPEIIANLVYSSRMGNGPAESGEGWKYRGRGYIQLTGKSNYKSFDSVCNDNIVDNPDLVAIKYPLVSAGWFWQNHKLNEIADKGIDTEVVSKITKVINGGTNGLSDRIILFNKYLGILKHE